MGLKNSPSIVIFCTFFMVLASSCRSTAGQTDSELNANPNNPVVKALPKDDSKLSGRTLNCSMSNETATPWYSFSFFFPTESTATLQSKESAFFGSEEFPFTRKITSFNGSKVRRVKDRIEVQSTGLSKSFGLFMKQDDGNFEGHLTFAKKSGAGTPAGEKVTIECQFGRTSVASMNSSQAMIASNKETKPVSCLMANSSAKPWYQFRISFNSIEKGSVAFQEFPKFGASPTKKFETLSGWESATINNEMGQMIVESSNFAQHGFAELTERGGGFTGQFIFTDAGPSSLQNGTVDVTCTR